MRRFGLPIAVFLLAVAFLVARLYDVQVAQHDVWATEAANLVRSYHVEPYARGTIRDRTGRIVARDEELYELEFVWRDFRRGHPLGQVAMAWSLIVGAPVSLDEARAGLHARAVALARLTPREVQAFGRGGPLALSGTPVAPGALEELRASEVDVEAGAGDRPSESEAAARLRRRTRAGDLAFYLYGLLGLSPREERSVRRLVEDSGLADSTFVQLASIAQGIGPDQVLRDLEGHLDESLAHLARLAAELDWEAVSAPEGFPLDVWYALDESAKLVALVEARRAAVEDETADALFSIALGFPPWRFDQANLGRLELGWLDALLGWNYARRLEWVRRRGAEWPAMVDGWLAGHVIARAKLALQAWRAGSESGSGDPADALLSAVAHAFRADADGWARKHGAPEDWRRIEDLEGLASLPDVLARGRELARADLAEALPFQRPARRASRATGEALVVEVFGDSLGKVASALEAARAAKARDSGQALGVGALAPITRIEAASFLLELVDSRRYDWDVVDRKAMAALLGDVEVLLQKRLTRALQRLSGEGADGGAKAEPIRVTRERIDRAEETRRYIVRDRGSRAKVVGGEPGYELVHLITRHPREFAGFRVRPTTRRVRPTDLADGLNHHALGVEVARFLVGQVRHPYLVDLLRQRPSEVELAEMQRKLALPEEDREEIIHLVEASWHPEERMGGSGIEGWFDRELSGKEGYSEFQGLQDRKADNRAPIHRPPIDGQDVWLTLDLELQRATEDLLLHPATPPDPKTDPYWFMNPVGAIVLATTEGELLVAASTPIERLGPYEAIPPDTDGQRRFAIDRTLRRPRGEPPGSIIKPIFAAYALQNLGVGFDQGLAVCSIDLARQGARPKGERGAGWGRIDCNSTNGHSRSFGPENSHLMTMSESLVVSCNTYFAALGEVHYGGASTRAALEMFGLGRPTGVRMDPGGRSGLAENSAFDDPRTFPEGGGPEEGWQRQFVGNGLSFFNVNVVQMARAYAGLATGSLPTMRLVRRIGDEDLPPELAPIPIDAAHFARVRTALRSVITNSLGSGNKKGLSSEDLGFALAGKTGSADYRPIPAGTSAIVGQDSDYMRKLAWFAGFFPYEAPRYVVIVYVHDTSATASHTATYLASQFLRLAEVQRYLEREGVVR